MLNDAKMGWIVALVAVLFTVAGFVKDLGGSSQKVDAMEKQMAAFMTQQSTQAETLAKHSTQFLDVERRLNGIDRQMASVAQMDARLGRIEVIVEMIGRQLGAPVPQRSTNP